MVVFPRTFKEMRDKIILELSLLDAENLFFYCSMSMKGIDKALAKEYNDNQVLMRATMANVIKQIRLTQEEIDNNEITGDELIKRIKSTKGN